MGGGPTGPPVSAAREGLMGAVKAAMRSTASRALGEALDTVNRVLPSVKEPAMYATLAAIPSKPLEEILEAVIAAAAAHGASPDDRSILVIRIL
jgi:hypothetical protein